MGRKIPPALVDLCWFDGAQLYERAGDARSAPAFDFAKGEIRSILLSNAAFWLDRYHVDAIRTDFAGAAFLAALLKEYRDRVPGLRLLVRDDATAPTLSSWEIARVVTGRHDDPFAVLGMHPPPREWRPESLAMPARSLSAQCCQTPSLCRCYRRISPRLFTR